MAWVWSDELAAALETAGAPGDAVAALRRSPVGLAVPDGEDTLTWAATLLGIELRSTDDSEAKAGPGPSPITPATVKSSL